MNVLKILSQSAKTARCARVTTQFHVATTRTTVGSIYYRQQVAHNITSLSSVHSSKDVSKATPPSDNLIQAINSAPDTLFLLDLVAQHGRRMSSLESLKCLEAIFLHQKQGTSKLNQSNLLRHPEFDHLCSVLHKHVRKFELTEVLEVLKILNFFGVRTTSRLITTLLSLVRYEINEISLQQLYFLEFLLTKCESTPLVEALRIALPMIFEIQVPLKIDHENVNQLADLISFTAKNRVSEKVVMNIVSALTLHGDELEPDAAIRILKALCELETYKPNYDRLVGNCFVVLNRNIEKLKFNDIVMTASRTSNRFADGQKVFYNEEFYDKSAAAIVERDVDVNDALFLLKHFNRIAHVNFELLNHIAKKLVNRSNLLGLSTTGILSIISGFSKPNYQNPDFELVKHQLFDHPLFSSRSDDFPWLRTTVELFSFDCYDTKLLARVFDPDFLKDKTKEDFKKTSLIYVLTLHQCVKTMVPEYEGPLPDPTYLDEGFDYMTTWKESALTGPLEVAFGGPEFVHHRLRSRLRHLIDHAVVFDAEGRPIKNEEEEVGEGFSSFEELERKYNGRAVAINYVNESHFCSNIPRLRGVVQVRFRTLDALKIRNFQVHEPTWNSLPDYERIPYLEQKIRDVL